MLLRVYVMEMATPQGFDVIANQELLQAAWVLGVSTEEDCPEVPKLQELQVLAQIVKDVATAVAALSEHPLTLEYVHKAATQAGGTVRARRSCAACLPAPPLRLPAAAPSAGSAACRFP